MTVERQRMREILGAMQFVVIAAFVFLDPFGWISPGILAAQVFTPGDPTDQMQGIGNALLKVFILAVFIEVGLSVVFRWRVFLRYAEEKGWKVPIAFVVSFLVVWQHEINLPGEVVAAFETDPKEQKDALKDGIWVGYFVGALIISGGSAAVNSIFERLGWRKPTERLQRAEAERRKHEAWLRISVKRHPQTDSERQPLAVLIDGVEVGTIPADKSEFGGTAGHPVKPGTRSVAITWLDPKGEKKQRTQPVECIAGKITDAEIDLA